MSITTLMKKLDLSATEGFLRIGEISKRDKEISKNLYKWLEKDNFTELKNFYETFKEKENVSQRRKDQMKMLHFLCKLRQEEKKD